MFWNSANLARGSHPSLIRIIEWIPTLGRTSVHKRAYPLTTEPAYSQPRLCEPRTTTRASSEDPWISAQRSPTSINRPPRQCNAGLLRVDSNRFCTRTTNLSLIGVVSISHNKLLENWAAYFEQLPGRISTEFTHPHTAIIHMLHDFGLHFVCMLLRMD